MMRLVLPFICLMFLLGVNTAYSGPNVGIPCPKQLVKNLFSNSYDLKLRLYERLAKRPVDSASEMKAVYARMAWLRVQIARQASDSELRKLVQRVMSSRIREEGYLPGWSVDSSMLSVDNLIRDAIKKRREDTVLTNIVRNVNYSDLLKNSLLKKLDKLIESNSPLTAEARELFEAWKKLALDAELYKTLEQRIMQGHFRQDGFLRIPIMGPAKSLAH